MKKIFVILFFIPLFANAQCNEKTKELIDSIKSSIPYPKFNVGDVLYIAFINDPNVGTDNVTEKDVDVMKVKIVSMSVFNSIEGPDFRNVLSVIGPLPIQWEYSFVDTSIPNPKFGDFSDFYPEERFSKTANGAKQILINRK